MNRLLLGATLLFVAASGLQAQDDAKALVTKAIQTAGMPMDNKAYHETWKEVGKMTAMNMTIPYESNWAFEAPDKYRFEMKGEFQGQKIEITFIQNGKRAKQAMGPQKEELQGPKLEETMHSAYQFWVCTLRPLINDPGFTLAVVGEKEFAGKPVTSVKVTRPGHREVTLHFDKKTGLLAGCSDRVKDEFQGWKEVAQDTEFTDYEKSAHGEMFFKTMTVKRDGKALLQSTMNNYQRSTTLQPDKFKLD
jgi:hypothetical protein